jgi:hypothetical protein
MLPDFPKIKNKLGHGTYRYLIKNFHQTSLLTLVPKKVYFEGGGFSFQHEHDDDEAESNSFKEIRSKFTIDKEDMLDKGPIAYIEGMLGAIKEMDDEGEKLIINKMIEATEKSGNALKYKGKISPEDILEMYAKIPISFDENGNHNLALITGEDDNAIKEALYELHNNPKYIKKYEKLIEKKRQKWNDSENNRKLVD